MHERLKWLEPSELDAAQRTLYDRIVNGPRVQGPQSIRLVDERGRLEGPFNALLVAPDVGTALVDIGTVLRYRGALAPRCREIAILELAARRRAEFEWYAHARIGRAAGLSAEEIDGLLAGEPVPTFDETESLVRTLVGVLLVERDLDAALFARAVTVLGEPVLMELIALVGYYDLLALSMRVWRTPLPADGIPVFGDV